LGADNPGEGFNIGLDTRFLGRLSDDTSLVVAYSAADVFVAPSKQENLPNMVMEAMSCGVPSVAFDIGGMPDMIKHGENGYLAQPYDVDDLADGILWGLLDNASMSVRSKAARKKIVLEYSEDVIAHRHASLYEQLICR
jgi:glycosyltransferase involved in cell wall biosynthesis